MKVTEQTQSRIVVMGSPLGQMAIGGLFIALGLIVAITFLRRGSPLGLLICLPFLGIGIFQLVTARRVTVVADRSAGTVSIAWRSLLAAGESSVGIATIDRIAYREFISEHRDRHGKRMDRDATSSLVLTDGSTVLLDRERDTSSRYSFSLPRSRDRSADRELAMFLGVSMVDNGVVVVAASAQTGQAMQPAQPAQAAPLAQAAPPLAQPAQASRAEAPAQAPVRPAQTVRSVLPGQVAVQPVPIALPGQAMVTPTEHPPWLQ